MNNEQDDLPEWAEDATREAERRLIFHLAQGGSDDEQEKPPERIWLHTGPFDPNARIYFTTRVVADDYAEYVRADIASTGDGERVGELEAFVRRIADKPDWYNHCDNDLHDERCACLNEAAQSLLEPK